MSDVHILLTTTDSDESAAALARALVERRVAACVNVVGAVRSIYRWRGAIADESERLLVVKTSAELRSRAEAAIRELHPYDVPEILALVTDGADPAYRAWLLACLEPESTGDGG